MSGGASPLLSTGVLNPVHLENCVQAWVHQYKRETELLERVRGMATKKVKGSEFSSCEERLREPRLSVWRRLKGNLICYTAGINKVPSCKDFVVSDECGVLSLKLLHSL